MEGLLLWRKLDLFHARDFLDPALYLFSLGGLVPESIDERLELMDFFLLVSVCGFELGPALRLLGQECLIIAAVKIHPAIPDFHDLGGRDVQKVAVVGDQHERVRVGGKIAFEPVPCLKVQVIGRLIKQQQVRPLQQELGQHDSHLPATGKFLRTTVQIRWRES